MSTSGYCASDPVTPCRSPSVPAATFLNLKVHHQKLNLELQGAGLDWQLYQEPYTYLYYILMLALFWLMIWKIYYTLTVAYVHAAPSVLLARVTRRDWPRVGLGNKHVPCTHARKPRQSRHTRRVIQQQQQQQPPRNQCSIIMSIQYRDSSVLWPPTSPLPSFPGYTNRNKWVLL